MKTKCFIFMPQAFVGFDSVIPFVTCLKEYNDWNVHCLFFNRSQFEQLECIPIYEDILKESSSIYILKSGSWMRSYFNIINIFIRFLFALNPRVISISGETQKGKIRKLIKLISVIKGKYYVLPNYNAPMPMEFFENYYTKALCNNAVRKKLGKKPGKFDAYKDKRLIGELLLQSDYDNERADFFGHPKLRKYLGYYKLHEPWLNKIADDKYIQNDKLRIASKCVFLITKKAGEYFFDSYKDYIESISESIRAVRTVYPNILIVIKPKPFRAVGVNDWILEYIESLDDEKIVVDYTPLTFTAHKAILAIFNIASTAYFDFVVNDVPCIEHARYGKTYYQINPNGSYMQNYGAVRTSNEGELVEFITKVKNEFFPIFGKSSIENMIEHKAAADGFSKL